MLQCAQCIQQLEKRYHIGSISAQLCIGKHGPSTIQAQMHVADRQCIPAFGDGSRAESVLQTPRCGGISPELAGNHGQSFCRFDRLNVLRMRVRVRVCKVQKALRMEIVLFSC